MAAAKPMTMRREIVARYEQGERRAAIARELGVSYGMVRKLWRQYQQTGQLEPGYERCRHTALRKGQAVYEQAVALKTAHPGWGAGLIRMELGAKSEGKALPSTRTLQRWFRRAGVGRPRAEKQAKPSVQRGQQAHEVWAMDAKEQIRLADGSYVSWLTITDEGSGAILAAQLFPPAALDEC
jgi:transposase-like protein